MAMHDPLCVAFEIKRPWPHRREANGWRYWPALITVWHREPGGHDSGTVCSYRTHWRHPWHWRIQVHPLQTLRRRLLTRCSWCGGRSRKGDWVNISHQWDGKRGPWWRGERGLFHRDCSMIENAHRTCVCDHPICRDVSVEHGPYGACTRCGKFRQFGLAPQYLAVRQRLAAIPAGQRDVEGGHSNGN
jgi:hypothetical protein